MGRLLTIGMPTFEDFDGMYFTIEHIRSTWPRLKNEIEFRVVDNNVRDPDFRGASHKFCKSVNRSGWKMHVEDSNWMASSCKDLVFDNESTHTLCIDSHVILEPDSIDSLLRFYHKNPKFNGLVQGRLLFDHSSGTDESMKTHMNPHWSGTMWGVWGRKEFLDPDSPIDVPMHGCGMMSCRTDSWMRFNRMFHGFGAEEGYIHNKFRICGRRTVTLPSFIWRHRFTRPKKPRYDRDIKWVARNYMIGFGELGLNTDSVIDGFQKLRTFSGESGRRELETLRDVSFSELADRRHSKELAFSRIANSGTSPQEHKSGPGSSRKETRDLSSSVSAFINERGVQSIVNCPCGAPGWLEHSVRLSQGASSVQIELTSVDIVDGDLIYRSNNYIKGDLSDLSSNPLPSNKNLLICRDALVHMTFEDIAKSLSNICRSRPEFIALTNFFGVENKNVRPNFSSIKGWDSCPWRPLDMTATPFFLPQPEEIISEKCPCFPLKCLAIWRTDKVMDAMSFEELQPTSYRA